MTPTEATSLLVSATASAAACASSEARFGDGGSYRIEIPSVEGPEALHTVLDAADERGVTVHRISQGSGIAMLTDAELREYARIGAENCVEVCLFVGPRAPWNAAASALTPDGGVFGWRHTTLDTLKAAYDDVMRACDFGIRSILASDEGLVVAIDESRRSGALPVDLVVKGSALLGVSNALGARLLTRAGIDTINVASDVTIRDLAAFRALTPAILDIYVEGPDGLGGFVRYHDIGELVRVGAPIHLKFGLRNAGGVYPAGEHLSGLIHAGARERVRRAALGVEHLRRQYPDAQPSPAAHRAGIPQP